MKHFLWTQSENWKKKINPSISAGDLYGDESSSFHDFTSYYFCWSLTEILFIYLGVSAETRNFLLHIIMNLYLLIINIFLVPLEGESVWSLAKASPSRCSIWRFKNTPSISGNGICSLCPLSDHSPWTALWPISCPLFLRFSCGNRSPGLTSRLNILALCRQGFPCPYIIYSPPCLPDNFTGYLLPNREAIVVDGWLRVLFIVWLMGSSDISTIDQLLQHLMKRESNRRG